ncbi:MAG: AbrB/MazE/SpoVT family DNA-binding domain-containing protein [Candidatus Methanofastidiosia archaeon]
MTGIFEAKLRKVGNSLGIIIPSEIIQKMGFHKGDKIHVAISPLETTERNELIKRLAGVDVGKPPFERGKGDPY